MTVKAFIKSEEKKREKERAGSIAATPATPIEPAAPATDVVESVEQPVNVPDQQVPDGGQAAAVLESERPGEEGGDEPGGAQASIEVNTARNCHQSLLTLSQGSNEQQNQDSANNNAEQTTASEAVAEEKADGSAEKTGLNGQMGMGEAPYGDGQNFQAWNGGEGQGAMYGGGFSFDGTQAGFSGMDWTGANGFNPMMQMQMQNNMQGGNWNGYPNMMGMSSLSLLLYAPDANTAY